MNAPKLLKNGQGLVIQRYFELIDGKNRDGFISTPSGRTQQLWDPVIAYDD